jgi:phospholipid transport system transporter-binding protein
MTDCEEAAVRGAFTEHDGAWRFDGALTLDNAAEVLATVEAQPLPASGDIDFAGLARADSSALALILALRRRAVAEGRPLSVRNLPGSLASLAAAYGVDELVRAEG